jgi:16S rRNA (cytidine1402-2'-O)-methyltransferase
VRAPLGELAARYGAEPPRGECTLVVQGASADQAAHVAASEDAGLADISARMRALLAQGLGPKDAAARMVVVTGKPRRQLYQLALSLQRDASSESPGPASEPSGEQPGEQPGDPDASE